MERAVAFIGFGEAGAALSGSVPARGYDRKTDDAATRTAKLSDFAAAGVTPCLDAAAAVADAAIVLSLVTADQQLAAARAAAPHLAAGALFLDGNSVAPDAKRQAARLVEAAGGRYVDVAVMAPVHPARRAVAMLVSGPHALDGKAALEAAGMTKVTIAQGGVGAASSIKMIRSIVVKGIEALTAECVLAAREAGVLDEVLASLDASPPPATWAERADYNLDRMIVHGGRRAAEMAEVVRTLDALGTRSAMSRATMVYQHAIGAVGLAAPGGPPKGLDAKLALLLARQDQGA
jgi:3-hydroxyisobutyrate dehydrogenase-like beta-hydroxyacid dehydrogenase